MLASYVRGKLGHILIHCILNVFMCKMWGVILLYTCVRQVRNNVIGSVF